MYYKKNFICQLFINYLDSNYFQFAINSFINEYYNYLKDNIVNENTLNIMDIYVDLVNTLIIDFLIKYSIKDEELLNALTIGNKSKNFNIKWDYIMRTISFYEFKKMIQEKKLNKKIFKYEIISDFDYALKFSQMKFEWDKNENIIDMGEQYFLEEFKNNFKKEDTSDSDDFSENDEMFIEHDNNKKIDFKIHDINWFKNF